MSQALSTEGKTVRGELCTPDETRHAAQQRRISFIAHNKIFQRNQSMANCNNRHEKFLVFHLFACELLDY